MKTPNHEIDQFLSEAKALEGLDYEKRIFQRMALAQGVVQIIFKHEDPNLFKQMPAWIRSLVLEMRDDYKRTGYCLTYTSANSPNGPQ